MSRAFRVVISAAVLLAAVAIGTVALGVFTPDPNEVCDGVQRTLGGCDADQPSFVGNTCQHVAREYGDQLNARILAILRGPEVVDGRAKSSQVSTAEGLLTVRANQHLRRGALVAECGAEEFLATAESQFSDQMKIEVGPAISRFQDHQVTYDEWRANLLKTLRVIDMEEDAPA